jgi:hypothetical protein
MEALCRPRRLDAFAVDVIQVLKSKLRIMRYELGDFE